jgi:aconitate hydratase
VDDVFNKDMAETYKKAATRACRSKARTSIIGDGDVVIAAITSCTNTRTRAC